MIHKRADRIVLGATRGTSKLIIHRELCLESTDMRRKSNSSVQNACLKRIYVVHITYLCCVENMSIAYVCHAEPLSVAYACSADQMQTTCLYYRFVVQQRCLYILADKILGYLDLDHINVPVQHMQAI